MSSPFRFLWLVSMARLPVHSEAVTIVLLSCSRSAGQKSTATSSYISTAESVLAGIAAPVPIGSAPALS
jgi:hypothetical protein